MIKVDLLLLILGTKRICDIKGLAEFNIKLMNDRFNSTQTIIFEDSIIDIQYNCLLTKQPYLVRLYGYISEQYEIRMSRAELKQLTEFINLYLEKN